MGQKDPHPVASMCRLSLQYRVHTLWMLLTVCRHRPGMYAFKIRFMTLIC